MAGKRLLFQVELRGIYVWNIEDCGLWLGTFNTS